MHRHVAFALSMVVFGWLFEGHAQAQDGRGLTDGIIWNHGAGLIGYWQVREELKLTPDQVVKIKVIGDKYIEEFEAALRDQKLSRQERKKAGDEFERRKDTFPTADILTAEQATRFRQMQLWDMDHRAFVQPDVIKELELTGEQVELLKTIGSEFWDKITEQHRQNPGFGRLGGRGISEEEMAKNKAIRDELRATTEKKCLEVLIDAQKSKFEKMRGKKFEIDLSALRKGKQK